MAPACLCLCVQLDVWWHVGASLWRRACMQRCTRQATMIQQRPAGRHMPSSKGGQRGCNAPDHVRAPHASHVHRSGDGNGSSNSHRARQGLFMPNRATHVPPTKSGAGMCTRFEPTTSGLTPVQYHTVRNWGWWSPQGHVCQDAKIAQEVRGSAALAPPSFSLAIWFGCNAKYY